MLFTSTPADERSTNHSAIYLSVTFAINHRYIVVFILKPVSRSNYSSVAVFRECMSKSPFRLSIQSYLPSIPVPCKESESSYTLLLAYVRQKPVYFHPERPESQSSRPVHSVADLFRSISRVSVRASIKWLPSPRTTCIVLRNPLSLS